MAYESGISDCSSDVCASDLNVSFRKFSRFKMFGVPLPRFSQAKPKRGKCVIRPSNGDSSSSESPRKALNTLRHSFHLIAMFERSKVKGVGCLTIFLGFWIAAGSTGLIAAAAMERQYSTFD